MSHQSAAAEFDPVAIHKGDDPNARHDEHSLDAKLRISWPRIAAGIVLAGAAYPTILASAFIGFGILTTRPSIREFPMIVVFAGIYSVVGGFIGLIWTSVVAAMTLPLVYLVVRSLKMHGSIVWLGAFSGGLVGFTAVMPYMLLARLEDVFGEFWAAALMLAAGPGLTTVLGQLGGGWGAWRAARPRQWYEPAMSLPMLERQALEQAALVGDSRTKPPVWQGIRFGTRHLLWIAVWLSLLLSVIRLSGVPFEFALPLLAGWVLYQMATLWIGGRLAARLAP